MISVGSRLGPYEILAPLGSGGMGEVYKAKDTRLERTVAVKVLPSHLSSSPEIRQRFEREAKTISQLSHPHICALYDVGREGETEFLVMEYLEGETLSDRLGRGALPVEQTLRYGIEIADALDKAHRQGIVHRDLKPGNVMLTKSGVKLLDFGLAKAMAGPVQPSSGLTSLPTAMGGPNLTQEGTILGTFQYMAPEQLEGKEADARTDIFAFGAVLYEMATGRKAFSGTSQASLISSIMKDEPAPISTVQPMSPPALDRVIRTCLAKDPEDRWQSAHDVESELKWIASASSEAGVPAPVVSRRKNRERIAWGLLGVMSAVALLLAIGYVRRVPKPIQPIRFEILPFGADLGQQFGLAVAPDGRRVAYIAGAGQSKRQIWIRALGEVASRPLAGTEGATFPFWSPDGAWIGFFAEGKLKKVAVLGGSVQVICEAQSGRGGTWGRDGTILFAGGFLSGIDRVSAAGGTPAPVTHVDEASGEASHRWPSFLPDGRHFLYLVYTSESHKVKNATGGVFLGLLDGKEKRPVRPEPSSAMYVDPGYVLFYRDGNLLAQPFDSKALKAFGDPIAVAERVSYDVGTRLARFSVSGDALAYLTQIAPPHSRLVWLDRAGHETGQLGDAGLYDDVHLSPNGKGVAVAKTEPDLQRASIWVLDTSRATATRVSDGSRNDGLPVWFPDGKRVAFVSGQLPSGVAQMFVTRERGGVEPLLKSDHAQFVNDISRDGRFLSYTEFDEDAKLHLWVMDLGKGAAPTRLFDRMKFSEYAIQFAPDGGSFAYLSDETGKPELYLSRFPANGERFQVSIGGAGSPRWSRDGKELFYFKEGRKLMAVDVKTQPKLDFGTPKMLFEVRYAPSGDWWGFDVSVDGKKFLVSLPEGEPSPGPINVLLNWTAILPKQR